MTPDGESLRRSLAGLPVWESAPLLVGAVLETAEVRAQIVEVEAYAGDIDPGSHAYRGRTPRNAVMYGRAGSAYVYFCYGCHWMLNVVAGPEGVPWAILVRAAMPLDGVDRVRARRPRARNDKDLLSGPGKLAQGLAVGPTLNGADLLNGRSALRLVPGVERRVVSSTRVGLAPGKGEDLPWRYVDAELGAWASRG